jgi:CRISPR system Cascade subunit CasA
VFNLLNAQWLPALRAEGQVERIRPAEITSGIEENPIVAIDWSRADFRVACIEFLIGLIATACPPADDEEAWIDGWEKPPSPETLSTAFAPIAHAFDLDGRGPRFLQDFDELPGEPDSPETLLIEAPGENTRRRNTALLIKPDRILRLSRPAAAMALFTLQCYAPQGGSGHRTSLRGGGPLTTLILPGRDPSLWQLIWANVPVGKSPSVPDLAQVFPWLAPTRTADRFPETTPINAHRLQTFWGMPRRIRLQFSENVDGAPCDLTGAADDVVVTGWRQQKNGVKYTAWDHPLSPSYKDKKGEGWITQLARAGIGYRDWVAIALGDEVGTRRPALCISRWRTRSADLAEVRDHTRLLAAGFHMVNSMKASAFVESEMPLPGTDPVAAETIAKVARRLVEAAGIAASALRSAVRQARFSRDTNIDSAPLAAVYESFWAATQDRFFDLLPNSTAVDWETALAATAAHWRAFLKSNALRLFDEAAPLDISAASCDPRRIVEARRNLFGTLDGRGPMGNKLFEALQLPSPEPKAKRRQRAAAMEPT